MIKNYLCFDKQFDDRLYQAFISHNGTWQEALIFASEFYAYVKQNHDEAKAKQDAANAEKSSEPVVESEVVDAEVTSV